MTLKYSPKVPILYSPLIMLALVACSSGDEHGSDVQECGGHGHLHGDHCHCDDGYVPDENDDSLCLEQQNEQKCGGHGHLHDDQCECDAGYVLDDDDESLCVAESDEDPNGMGGMNGEGGDSDLRAARLAVADSEIGEVTVLSLEDGDVVGSAQRWREMERQCRSAIAAFRRHGEQEDALFAALVG